MSEKIFKMIEKSDVKSVEKLLKEGADANTKRTYHTSIDRESYTGSETLLMAAVIAQNDKIVNLLLKHGADPNVADDFSGRTPIIQAAADNSLAIIKLLCSNGANISSRDGLRNENALTAAIAGADLKTIKFLIEHGCPIEKETYEKASFLGRTDILEIFSKTGQTCHHEGTLQMAAISGQVKAVKWLAEKGVDLAKEGPAALHEAANAGKSDVVRELIAMGVPINTPNSYGWSALHLAAYNATADTVKTLIELGADPNLDDGTGKTALDWAQEQGKPDIVKILKKAVS